jgi:hypothetical protein
MGLYQVVNGFVLADFSKFGNKKSDIDKKQFPEKIIDQIIEGPDNVKIGWGYDEKNNKFIIPEIPEGWAYDEETGTFAPDSDALKREIQMKSHPELYLAVVQGYLTKENFLKLTEENFIENGELRKEE